MQQIIDLIRVRCSPNMIHIVGNCMAYRGTADQIADELGATARSPKNDDIAGKARRQREFLLTSNCQTGSAVGVEIFARDETFIKLLLGSFTAGLAHRLTLRRGTQQG